MPPPMHIVDGNEADATAIAAAVLGMVLPAVVISMNNSQLHAQ